MAKQKVTLAGTKSSRRSIDELESAVHQIALYVRRKRRDLDYTQDQLSKRAGVGLRFLKELETGKTSLRLDKVEQVLEFLGATLIAVDQKELNQTQTKGQK